MARSTKVIGFSLPPEISDQLDSHAAATHKTRSELMRDMIEQYFSGAAASSEPASSPKSSLAASLKAYWQLRSEVQTELITVGLALLWHPTQKKILICRRTEEDRTVRQLSWVFPGASLASLDFRNNLKISLEERTGLSAEVTNLISARLVPDTTASETQVVALYFEAKAGKSQPVLDKKKYSKALWIKPAEIFRYFTTSVSDEVTKYLLAAN